MLSFKNHIVLKILRRENAKAKPYWQEIDYTLTSENDTVAIALDNINSSKNCIDLDGNVVKPIRWECSCLQKKCGACAMVIDGRPRLACDTFLAEFARKKVLTIQPLRKFPCIKDLVVDRSMLHEHLKTMQIWTDRELSLSDEEIDVNYESSLCLQCGCCLEVCPNFNFDEEFFGAASYVPASRLLMSLEENDELKKSYKEHIYKSCAKSLSCKDICPMGIDTEKLLVKSNAIATWNKKIK